jgi:threonine/homoserine/homoserine lactone efflux protein
MAALLIFLGIALGGCAFLFYFLYALWREEYGSKRRARVEITTLPIRKDERAKLLRLYPARKVMERKRL